MSSVRIHLGNLFFDFRYQGVRCREYTKLRDTPSNRKRMQKILDQIEQAIVTGTFQYADFFPGSKLVQRFADGGASQAVSQAQPAMATMASGTPLFRTFIEDWFTLSLPSWRKSHAGTVRSTLDARRHGGSRSARSRAAEWCGWRRGRAGARAGRHAGPLRRTPRRAEGCSPPPVQLRPAR